ncbi:Smr/MutS family protein [Cerasicoccus arenae]|nr:Smr/MutS family protein [Cerasicoccus arenae]
MDEPDYDAPIELPIDGVLDLHTFAPRDVKELLPVYFEECLERGITQVRVIHGKGTGALRELVHAQLRKIPQVTHYQLAGESGGGWGATIVELAPR